MTLKTRSSRHGFSLTELLVVIAIMGLLAGISVPAVQSMQSTGATNQAMAELAGTYEMARTYAMSNHTYVRVGTAQIAAGGGVALPMTVVSVIASADGSLANDTAVAMADNSRWTSIAKPLVLRNLWIYDALNASAPDTSADAKPSGTDITSYSRTIAAVGPTSFTAIVQFNPAGEAQVLKGEAARYIKIGLDQPKQPANTDVARNQNPFVIRISGLNGSVSVIRKEDLH